MGVKPSPALWEADRPRRALGMIPHTTLTPIQAPKRGVAWYRSLRTSHGRGVWQSPSDGGNCWPHSAVRRLRGRSRRARSRASACDASACSWTQLRMIRNSSPASRYSCKHSLSSRESDLRDPCQPTAYLCPKAEDGNRRKSVLQRARQRSG